MTLIWILHAFQQSGMNLYITIRMQVGISGHILDVTSASHSLSDQRYLMGVSVPGMPGENLRQNLHYVLEYQVLVLIILHGHQAYSLVVTTT